MKLHQKIKNICFWTFGGIFWYLVVSYFLLSDYPIQEQPFNHKEAYEVIKDALGLAAAFLAPVIAVVLFSDWREQHASQKNEKISLEFKNLLNTSIANLSSFKRNYCDEQKVQQDIKHYFNCIRDLDRFEREITVFNSETQAYLTKVSEINTLMFECGVLWKAHFDAFYSQDHCINHWNISKQISLNVSKLNELSSNLKSLMIKPE